LENFELKIEQKLVKHLNKETKKKWGGGTGLSRLDDTQIIFNDMQYNRIEKEQQ
jgi:hypothetical protein